MGLTLAYVDDTSAKTVEIMAPIQAILTWTGW